MANRFEDKTVIVTGSGRGIGKAVATSFFREGARIVLVSRTQKELSEVEEELNKETPQGTPIRVSTFCGDCSQDLHVQALFEFVQRRFGKIDILVNNAGFIDPKPITEMSSESFRRHLDVNLGSTFLCSREAFKVMKRQGGGVIVNVSSLAGMQSVEKFKGFSAYTAAKMGVTGLTECLAVEGREFGIRVNAVAPGAVDTRMLRDALPGFKTDAVPRDIAPMILFLCDPNQARMITGAVIPIYTSSS